jgi:hypothetical protein
MLFACQIKLRIWQYALIKYVEEIDWTGDIIISLFYLRPPVLNITNGISQFLLLGTILATIWKYHHSSIRDEEDFNPQQVSAAIDTAITLVLAQLEGEKRRQDPVPRLVPAAVDTNFPT